MNSLFEQLQNDVRLEEGLTACISCGSCSAICPAAGFYNYDPRSIAVRVQSRDENEIEKLLKGEEIWYCGECMSCKTRCPRGNAPGLIIIALRSLSQDLGYFTESEKGRQQLAIKRGVGHNILDYGYCVFAEKISIETHPEQGPVWEWQLKSMPSVYNRLGANYGNSGPGLLRQIPKEALDEIKKIFDVTGGTRRFEKIELFSRLKAEEMNMEFSENNDCEYIINISTTDKGTHC